jgi:uncharacterized caspase-like protein
MPARPLSTTSRDARTVADELRRSEFDVDLKENLGKEEMQRAIDAFIGKLRSGSAALFYFNGYGIQAGRQTFSFRSMLNSGPKLTSGATASASIRFSRKCTARTPR